MRRFVLLVLPLSLVACAHEDPGACARALDRVATCFPDHASAPVCDPETADTIAEASCDDIAGWEGKSDNPWCVWTPWLCSGGGSSTGARSLRVAVDECGPGPLCPYTVSATCSMVTLHDDDDTQIAKGLTNEHGNITFENLQPGTYTVRVRKRDNTLAPMHADELSSTVSPAKVEVSVATSGEPRVYIHLTPGTGEAITQCADVAGDLTFEDAAGTRLDARASEWNWLVELETAGAVVDRMRALYIHPDRNTFSFRRLQKGSHTLRYVRMDIPSYEQRPNPDYARLRRLYSTDEAPVEHTVTITTSQFGKDVDVSRTLVDPLAP